jgi:hypothetical protein
MSISDACIVEKCEEAWEEKTSAGLANKNNCSGFIKGVAQKLGVPIPMTANADGIIDHVVAQGWTKLASGADAAQKAGSGMFVIAGLKASNHSPARSNGHVVVVVSGSLYRNTYPMCWGGSIGGAQSKGNKSVGEVWNRTDRDSVVYYMYSQAVCK